MTQKELFPGIPSKPEKAKKEVVTNKWKVPSFTSEKEYLVTQAGSKWSCDCPYFRERKLQCKHIIFRKQELGLVKPDISGFKSAIQKALRRGDLPLLRLSFQRLWEKDKRWLLWRLPILAGEETWQYTGQAGRLSFQENPPREDVWRLLANITLHPKDKDAEGLWIAARQIIEQKWNSEDWVQGDRLHQLKSWLDVVPKIDWKGEDKEEFWSWFNRLNGYERETIITCKRRFYRGGMGADRELMVVTAWLTATQGVKEPKLIGVPQEEDVEPAKELPWFVWDMHTSIGKIVRSELRKHIEDRMEWRYVSDDLWFNQESARCDRLAEGSFWWPLMLSMLWKRYGRTAEQAQKDWETWGPRIRALIEKCMGNQHVRKG